MVKEDENRPPTEEKGKGKAALSEADGIDGEADPKKDKDGKTVQDGDKPSPEGTGSTRQGPNAGNQ